MDYIKEIYELADGRYEIQIMRNDENELHYYEDEEEAYEAYLRFCEEIYA